MAKKSDFSDLAKKLDISGFVEGIKSMLSQEDTPEVDPDDAIGQKIVELSAIVQEVTKTHAELTKELTKVNSLLNHLFQDIEALRAQHKPTSQKSKVAEAQQPPKQQPKKPPSGNEEKD